MKLVIILTALVSFAFASGTKEGFSKRKEMILSSIDKRINSLNEKKSCISSAQDKEALKKCNQYMKEQREKMRGEMKAKREEFKKYKAERKAKRKAQKSE